jgi:hypothetical protein
MDLLIRLIVLTVVAISFVAAGALVARSFLQCPLCGRARKDGPLRDFVCGQVSIRKHQNRQWSAALPGHDPVLFFSKESALEYAIWQLDFELSRKNRFTATLHS